MASHSEVAHRWAQDDATARTIKGYNLFYDRSRGYAGLFAEGSEEQTIFSHGYHFPLAAFQTTPAGERVVLGNFHERRSVSTSQHQSEVRHAIPGRYRVFDVPHVSPRRKTGGSEGFHADNLAALVERAADMHGKARRARKNGDYYTRAARDWLEMATDYASAFALDWTAPASVAEAAAEVERLATEKAEAYRLERERRAEAERQRMAALREAQAEDFAAWISDAPGSRVPSSYATDPASDSVYLRRHGDELQTSRGASVPWDHAVKAFRFIKLCRERGEAFRRNGRVIRVGHFQVDSIDINGNMHAGCHYFAWEQIEAVARREGVFEMDASPEAVETREHA